MKNNSVSIPVDELARNRAFLDLHSRLELALLVTREAEGGADALQRFDAATNPVIYCEKNYC